MTYQWFGRSTSKWQVVPLREVARLGTGHTPSREVEEYWVDCTIPWVTVEDIRDHGEGSLAPLLATKQHISELGLANSAAVLHPKGTVMLSRTASIGFTCIIGRDMATTQAFVTWTPDESVLDGNFLHVALKAMHEQYDYLAYGATHLTIYFTDVKTLRIPLPPLSEQTQIAAFLDSETAKIDELVAEQRRLMELLKEKRQAVISHAVTKGLNPDAPMKPSGIEWLGEVPAHWEVKRFQRCVYVAEGQVDPEDTKYSSLALIAPNHIESGTGRLLGLESASDQGAESGKYLCKAGDVVYSKIRPALRKVCIAPEDCLCSADMYPLRAHSGLTNPFLRWSMLSEQFSALAVLESQRVAMPKINRESLKEVMLSVPPIDEQQPIVAFIDIETAKLDTLTAEAQRAIDLLQERRTALISAAVTGQIDVRQLTEKQAA